MYSGFFYTDTLQHGILYRASKFAPHLISTFPLRHKSHAGRRISFLKVHSELIRGNSIRGISVQHLKISGMPFGHCKSEG